MKKLILFAFVFSFLQISGQTRKALFDVFAVSDLHQIFEDGYNIPPPRDTVNVFGIKDEVISGQFVVLARKDLLNLSVEIGPLQSQSGSHEIPAEDQQYRS